RNASDDSMREPGFRFSELQAFQHVNVAVGSAVKKDSPHCQKANLAVDLLRKIPRLGPEYDTASNPERRAVAAGAGVSCPLLPPRLSAAAGNFRSRLRASCTLARVCLVGNDHLLDSLESAFAFENLDLGKLVFSARGTVLVVSFQLHVPKVPLLLCLLGAANKNIVSVRTRDAAADEQQVLVLDHLHNGQILNRAAAPAHAARHLLVL